MECWLEKLVHVHAWYLKVFLTYADQLAAYDAERKISLIINNVGNCEEELPKKPVGQLSAVS